MPRVAYVALFGVLGVVSRFYLNGLIPRAFASPSPFPYATFLINVAGSFAIGFLYVFGVGRPNLAPDVRIGLIVGFLGGFTTFSSYCVETATLLEASEAGTAALYFGLSPLVGLGACFLGLRLGRMLLSVG